MTSTGFKFLEARSKCNLGLGLSLALHSGGSASHGESSSLLGPCPCRRVSVLVSDALLRLRIAHSCPLVLCEEIGSSLISVVLLSVELSPPEILSLPHVFSFFQGSKLAVPLVSGVCFRVTFCLELAVRLFCAHFSVLLV